MSAHLKLEAQIRDRRGAYVDLLRDLVRISRGGEAAIQDFVASRLELLGCQVERIGYRRRDLEPDFELAISEAEGAATRVSVVGTLPGRNGSEGKPGLLLYAHPDSEPVRGVDRWQHDPFGAEIEEGRLYGWGVADDLVGVATMLAALEAVLGADLEPQGQVVIASTPSKNRAQGIVAVLDHGYLADAAVYLHPAESGAGLLEIKAVTLGLLAFTITVEGSPPDTTEPTHTPFAHLATDPLEKAWLLYRALADLGNERARTVRYPLVEERVGQASGLLIASLQCGDENSPTRVARECHLAGSITFPATETMASIQSQVIRTLDTVVAGDDWLRTHPPKITWTMGTEGSEFDLNHPLYRVASRAIAEVTGEAPYLNPLHASSDIRNPNLHRDIPTIGLGCLAGNLSQTGRVDEWVDIEDYLRAVHAGARIIVDWCDAVS